MALIQTVRTIKPLTPEEQETNKSDYQKALDGGCSREEIIAGNAIGLSPKEVLAWREKEFPITEEVANQVIILNQSDDFEDEFGNKAENKIRRNLIKRARTENFHPIIFEKLAEDEDGEYIASRNPNTPAYILGALADNENIRGNIAKNPNSPASVLDKLSRDEDVDIRADVARNRNTAIDTLKKLLKDKYVRWMAEEQLAERQAKWGEQNQAVNYASSSPAVHKTTINSKDEQYADPAWKQQKIEELENLSDEQILKKVLEIKNDFYRGLNIADKDKVRKITDKCDREFWLYIIKQNSDYKQRVYLEGIEEDKKNYQSMDRIFWKKSIEEMEKYIEKEKKTIKF